MRYTFRYFTLFFFTFLTSLYSDPLLVSSDYYASTEDGAEIYIRRYPQKGKPALILCPGLNQNANFWNIAGANPNFAHFFHQAGFDLWTFHYRGRGRHKKSTQSYRKINQVIVSSKTFKALDNKNITKELENLFRQNGHVFWKNKEISVLTPGEEWQIQSRDQKYHLKKNGLSLTISGFWHYCVDDLAIYDLPAVVEKVNSETSQPIYLVGHSMGAMICSIYLQGVEHATKIEPPKVIVNEEKKQWRNQKIAGAVFITMPPRMAWKYNYPQIDAQTILKKYPFPDHNLPLQQLVEMKWLKTFIPKPYIITGHNGEIIYSTAKLLSYLGVNARGEDVAPQSLRLVQNYSADKLSFRILEQFIDWVENQTFREFHPHEDRYVYWKNFSRIKVPALVIGTGRDPLACDDLIFQDFFQNLGSKEKLYKAFPNYGHVDIVIGRKAKSEIYPVIVNWLKAKQ